MYGMESSNALEICVNIVDRIYRKKYPDSVAYTRVATGRGRGLHSLRSTGKSSIADGQRVLNLTIAYILRFPVSLRCIE